MPHALLYDLTHDNESYLDKRSAEDALSTGALVAFSYSAIGSVKGFDDLYPKLLNLVQEKRRYAITQLDEDSGIAKAKRFLNGLKREMVLNGYEEGHVHQENDVSVLIPLFLINLMINALASMLVGFAVYRYTSRSAQHAERVRTGCAHRVLKRIKGSRL
jgi:hypothetical protein